MNRYKKNPIINKGGGVHKHKRDAYWYNGGAPKKPKDEIWLKAERLGEQIIEMEGFCNIQRISTLLGKRFPFDYLAERSGEKYAIEITCGQRKEMSSKLKNILKIFNLKIIFIFIKPDFSTYFISDADINKKCWYFNDCIAKPLQHTGNVNPFILYFNHIIQPFNFDNLQQVSYDLTLFRVFEVVDKGSIIANKTTLPQYRQIKSKKNIFILKAGKTYAIDFCEQVELPHNIFGMIYPRSSLNRMGGVLSSGIYDPGFKNRVGAILRVMHNDIQLEKFNRIATLLCSWANAATQYCGQYQGK